MLKEGFWPRTQFLGMTQGGQASGACQQPSAAHHRTPATPATHQCAPVVHPRVLAMPKCVFGLFCFYIFAILK